VLEFDGMGTSTFPYDVYSHIYGVDEDNHVAPTTFSEWSTDHSAHTTANVEWNFTPLPNVHDAVVAPDIVSIVQEIVDRTNWVSGNAIGLHIDRDYQVYEGGQVVATYEHIVDGYTQPKLTIVYCTLPPNPPASLDSPAGGETWRECETHNLTYTAADPEHPEGIAPASYHFQFSANGTFSDAVEIASGVTGGSYAWVLPASLVAADTNTCKVRVRSEYDVFSSTWVTSPAFTVEQSTAPVVSLVTPADGALIQGPVPTFIFGTADVEADDLHVEFQLSQFADYRDPTIDTDSTTDYADWEEAADPYSVWTTVGSGGATAGNRIRYTAPPLRYDTYYGRIRLSDNWQTAEWTEFTCVVSIDAGAALSVAIDGTAYNVVACRIVEGTNGDDSPINLTITLSAYLADTVANGDAMAISSALGGFSRSWNGAVETVTFSGDLVNIYGLQDDAYMSRKLCTGDKTSADLGANLAGLVTSYGAPLTGTGIDTTMGVTMAITGGYKYLREHFDDAIDACPDYIYWVTSGGDVESKSQSDYGIATYRLYEEDPSA
jgi:hypothetical protein